MHAAVWSDLIANGAPHMGRFYAHDADFGELLIFELANQTMPQRMPKPAAPAPAAPFFCR